MGQVYEEAKAMDKETRRKRKEVFDKKKRAALKEIVPGDRVLIKQKKTTVKPPYNHNPYTVTKVKAAQVTAQKGNTVRVRDMSRVMLLKQRPEQLRRRGMRDQSSDSESDDDYLNTKNLQTVPCLEQMEEGLEVDMQIQEQEVHGEQEQVVHQDQEQEHVAHQEQEQVARQDQEQDQVGPQSKRIRKPSLKLLESRASESSKQASLRQQRKAKAIARLRSNDEPEEIQGIQDIQESDFQDILKLDM